MSDNEMVIGSVKDIVIYPDSVLETPCEIVEESEFDSPELKQLVADLFETLKEHNGLGLAANQIGVNKRVAVVNVSEPFILINPELAGEWGEVESEEGCLSLPTLFRDIKRSEKVRIIYRALDGGRNDMVATDMQAVCIQHELDHLDGKVFIDHLSTLKRLSAKKHMLKYKNS